MSQWGIIFLTCQNDSIAPFTKGFVVFVVFGFCVGFVVCGFSGSVLLLVFVLFLVPFASLHALALSLTGA